MQERKQNVKMDTDIKAIIVMLATQAMINLGEIKDPVLGEARLNLEGAAMFMALLSVLEEKTRNNLTEEESQFLAGIRSNLEIAYQNKSNQQTR